jgi:2'-5' RNA ligase
VRCFVAIELPDEVRMSLGALQGEFSDLGKAVRWVRPDSIHLTLKFLGDVPDGQLTEVCRAVGDVASECGPFDFTVRGTGCFPPGGGSVRVVWVGLEETSGALEACYARCEDAFARLGFARESRSFTPHLTLGRVKDPRNVRDLRRRIADRHHFEAGVVEVDELILFESRLSSEGAQYVAVSRARFARPDLLPG